MEDATEAVQLEVGPRRAKTCAKKRKGADRGKGKVDEASKRPRLSSDSEQYFLGRIAQAKSLFGRPTHTISDEPISPICGSTDSGVEEMSIDSPGKTERIMKMRA